MPRHCGHYPFGLRELKRVLKGPDYARALVSAAQKAGVDIRTQTSVTKLHQGARLSLSTQDGMVDLQAERVILCTGVRESSRAQRLISGQRPMGGDVHRRAAIHGLFAPQNAPSCALLF